MDLKHPISRFAKTVAGTTLVILLPLFAVYSATLSGLQPDMLDIQTKNYAKIHAASYQKVIQKSRESAVQVVSSGATPGYFSSATGTYFKAYGSYFVVTVMHALQGPCAFTTLVHNEKIYQCIKYVVVDAENDYAIIQTEEIEGRTPIQIPKDLPKNAQWRYSYSVLNKVVYSGYPNTIGLLTLEGTIAGFAGTQYLYMNSYAWSGSSGSGVFDAKGKFMGYVVAIDVGTTEFGPQVLQNVVLVAPTHKVDWTKVITGAK